MSSIIDLSEINNDETSNTPELGDLKYHYRTLLDLQNTLSQVDSPSQLSLILYKDELEENISHPMTKEQALKILTARIEMYLKENKDLIQFNTREEIILNNYVPVDIGSLESLFNNFSSSMEIRLQFHNDIAYIKLNILTETHDLIYALKQKGNLEV